MRRVEVRTSSLPAMETSQPGKREMENDQNMARQLHGLLTILDSFSRCFVKRERKSQLQRRARQTKITIPKRSYTKYYNGEAY